MGDGGGVRGRRQCDASGEHSFLQFAAALSSISPSPQEEAMIFGTKSEELSPSLSPLPSLND